MDTTSLDPRVTPQGSARSHRLRMSWLWCGIAAALVLTGMAVGPGEGGSVVLLLLVLVMIVAGLAATVVSMLLSGRLLRDGVTLAMIPFLLDWLLLFWGAVAVLGTFGRFYGWDA